MVKRRTSQNVIDRNKEIVDEIKEIKSHHPFWGYRRVWAYLTYHKLMIINKKRVYALMKKHDLLVKDRRKLRAKRTRERAKPNPHKPNEIWGIDMTKARTEEGWAYIVLVIDWYSKKIVGSHCAERSTTEDWLEALHQGLNHQFPKGSREQKLKLVSDNGCQPTSRNFMRSCGTLGVKQIFTSYNNPKGNADTERLMRTLKEELIWIREFKSCKQLSRELKIWVESYNREYLHSALGYRPPEVFERSFREERVA